jgi:hypothetical protein
MRIRQLVTSAGQACGIAVAAEAIDRALTALGARVLTTGWPRDAVADCDALLVHYAPENVAIGQIRRLCQGQREPVVVIAHTDLEGPDDLADVVAAYVTFHPRAFGPMPRPVLCRPLPALAPPTPSTRSAARQALGLDEQRVMIGSSGFLLAHRRFPDMVGQLLPHAMAHDWLVYLATGRWMRRDHGLESALAVLQRAYPRHFQFSREYLAPDRLSLCLHACDLLWCWTNNPDRTYASGVASDQYASGSRLVLAEKVQHEHILGLLNVVRAPREFQPFFDVLLAEAQRGTYPSHDPSPVDIRRFARDVLALVTRVCGLPIGSG